jgi:hypothetical protein
MEKMIMMDQDRYRSLMNNEMEGEGKKDPPDIEVKKLYDAFIKSKALQANKKQETLDLLAKTVKPLFTTGEIDKEGVLKKFEGEKHPQVQFLLQILSRFPTVSFTKDQLVIDGESLAPLPEVIEDMMQNGVTGIKSMIAILRGRKVPGVSSYLKDVSSFLKGKETKGAALPERDFTESLFPVLFTEEERDKSLPKAKSKYKKVAQPTFYPESTSTPRKTAAKKKSSTFTAAPKSADSSPQKKFSPVVTRSQLKKASRSSAFSPKATLEKLRKDVNKGKKRWDEFDG